MYFIFFCVANSPTIRYILSFSQALSFSRNRCQILFNALSFCTLQDPLTGSCLIGIYVILLYRAELLRWTKKPTVPKLCAYSVQYLIILIGPFKVGLNLMQIQFL